jgi:hypothetical protein
MMPPEAMVVYCPKIVTPEAIIDVIKKLGFGAKVK